VSGYAPCRVSLAQRTPSSHVYAVLATDRTSSAARGARSSARSSVIGADRQRRVVPLRLWIPSVTARVRRRVSRCTLRLLRSRRECRECRGTPDRSATRRDSARSAAGSVYLAVRAARSKRHVDHRDRRGAARSAAAKTRTRGEETFRVPLENCSVNTDCLLQG